MPNYNGVWSLTTQFQYADTWNADNPNPVQGLFFGNNSATNVIQFLDLATTGNAADFGDLTVAGYGYNSGSSNGVRGILSILSTSSDTTNNIINYVTIAQNGLSLIHI